MASSSVGSSRKTPQLEIPPSPYDRPKINTRTTGHRLPPPSLFQGPPSNNASHISLSLPSERPPGAPGSEAENPRRMPRASRVPLASSFSGPALRQPTPDADDQRAENLWVEMQKTLADVELSTMNTSFVFGASHARALDDLRTAQLSLAQTWAKSEADEPAQHNFDGPSQKGPEAVGTLETKVSPGQRPKSAAGDDNPSAFTSNKDLEEETERDIQLARKRREANDRYFQQVNHGVLEVVGKLDEVAAAMRKVERESREIWDEDMDDEDEDRNDDENDNEDEDEPGFTGSDGEGGKPPARHGYEAGSATDGTGMTDSPDSKRKR